MKLFNRITPDFYLYIKPTLSKIQICKNKIFIETYIFCKQHKLFLENFLKNIQLFYDLNKILT